MLLCLRQRKRQEYSSIASAEEKAFAVNVGFKQLRGMLRQIRTQSFFVPRRDTKRLGSYLLDSSE